MANIGVFALIFDERRRVLCVRTAYGNRRWTTPGGRVEPFESPLDALRREVLEETGYVVEPGELAGVYAKPNEDDVVLSFHVEVLGREAWVPDEEIAEVMFFPVDDLPSPMTPAARARLVDGAAGVRGIYRVIEPPDRADGPD